MINLAPSETLLVVKSHPFTLLHQKSEFGLGLNLTVLEVSVGLLLAMSCMNQEVQVVWEVIAALVVLWLASCFHWFLCLFVRVVFTIDVFVKGDWREHNNT